MVCVVLEKSGGCLAQVEYSSHQLIKKEEGRFVPCVCVGFERWREDQLEQPQHTAGESGSGVECFTLPAKWTSLPLALKQLAGRGQPQATLDTSRPRLDGS